MEDILVIATGGTIDADAHDVRDGQLIVPKDVSFSTPESSRVLTYIKQHSDLRKHCKTYHFSQKDSKYLIDEDIEKLATIIKGAKQESFVLTVGTDRMADIGSKLQKLLQGTSKHVIITGAMAPLANPEFSTGIQGLYNACMKAPELHGGEVRLLMARKYPSPEDKLAHEIVFMNPDKVHKNFETRWFEPNIPGDTSAMMSIHQTSSVAASKATYNR